MLHAGKVMVKCITVRIIILISCISELSIINCEFLHVYSIVDSHPEWSWIAKRKSSANVRYRMANGGLTPHPKLVGEDPAPRRSGVFRELPLKQLCWTPSRNIQQPRTWRWSGRCFCCTTKWINRILSLHSTNALPWRCLKKRNEVWNRNEKDIFWIKTERGWTNVRISSRWCFRMTGMWSGPKGPTSCMMYMHIGSPCICTSWVFFTCERHSARCSSIVDGFFSGCFGYCVRHLLYFFDAACTCFVSLLQVACNRCTKLIVFMLRSGTNKVNMSCSQHEHLQKLRISSEIGHRNISKLSVSHHRAKLQRRCGKA